MGELSYNQLIELAAYLRFGKEHEFIDAEIVDVAVKSICRIIEKRHREEGWEGGEVNN